MFVDEYVCFGCEELFGDVLFDVFGVVCYEYCFVVVVEFVYCCFCFGGLMIGISVCGFVV